MDDFALREFIKRYSRTTAILKVKGKWEAVYINDIHTDDDGNRSILVSSRNTNAVIPVKNIVVKPLKNRICYSAQGYVLIFSRTTARQWKKGLTSENTTIQSGLSVIMPQSNDIRALVNLNFRNYVEISQSSVAPMLETTYHNSLKGAIDSISRKGSIQECITDEYWISLGYNDDEYLVCRFNVVVGVYSYRNDSVYSLTPLYRQELLDLVTRNNLNTRVL